MIEPLRCLVGACLIFVMTILPIRPQTAAPHVPLPADSSTPVRLSLEEAIRLAMAHHPSLQEAREALVAAEARTRQAKAGYYPQITASGFAKQGLSGASGALGLRGLVTSPLFRDIGASSAVYQNIFDFGRTSHGVKTTRWAEVSMKHAQTARQQLVILNVQRAYYSVLQQQRLVKVTEETLAERQLAVRQANAFYKAQLKSKADLTLAQVGAARAHLELVQSRDRLRTAFAELNHAMGVPGDSQYTLEEPSRHGGLHAPPSLESLIEESQKQRPDLAALDAQIKANEEIVARAESNRWPRLMGLFSGGWVRFSDLSVGKLMLGAFGIDAPVFTGGRLSGEIAEAKADAEQTRAAREALSQDIRLQVQEAYGEWLDAMASVEASEPLVTQAREALRLAQLRYRAQLGSFVELAAAEAAASSAETQYAESRYQYKLAEDVLHFTTGLGPQPPEQ